MIDLESFTASMELLLSFGALALLLRLYRDYRIDVLRERLFTIREELFDYAAEGHVEFDSPGYGRLRLLLNSLIRFAEDITGTRLFLLVVVRWYSRPSLGPLRDLEEALSSLPAPEQQRLRGIRETATREVAIHLMKSSPIPWLLLVIHVVKDATAWAITKLPGLDMLESQAVISEEPSLRANAEGIAPA